MAIIYDINAYRAPRLLSEFSQQTGGVVRMIEVQKDRLRELKDGIEEMQDTLGEAQASLEKAEEWLDNAQDMYEFSSEALESGNVEDMMRARDEIAHYRFTMLKNLHAQKEA